MYAGVLTVRLCMLAPALWLQNGKQYRILNLLGHGLALNAALFTSSGRRAG
jgi:hypothetical protein